MMKIGLIDVDGHNFPNLPLMKLSAYHKKNGDEVKWYDPLFQSIGEPLDKVYMSKVFSFTPDYEYMINAKEIFRGGSGYCIKLVDGKEFYDKTLDKQLPYEVEHTFPDYSIYPEITKDTAYGFMSRGCPRGCDFCHVKEKEGRKAFKVANLSEFWDGQKNIVLLDPNPIACREWEDIALQLIDSKANIDFSQGLDIRIMNEEKAKVIRQIRVKNVHFAWDRYRDKEIVIEKMRMFKEVTGWKKDKLTVYVLTNFDTTFEQDLERVYSIRDMGYRPYVMIYDKQNLPYGHRLRRLQRWVNSIYTFYSCEKFEQYHR